jgi:hypothetical protein
MVLRLLARWKNSRTNDESQGVGSVEGSDGVNDGHGDRSHHFSSGGRLEEPWPK